MVRSIAGNVQKIKRVQNYTIFIIMCFRSLPLNYMSRLLSVVLKIQQHNMVRVFMIIANNGLISFFCEMIMLHNLVTGKDGSESSQ